MSLPSLTRAEQPKLLASFGRRRGRKFRAAKQGAWDTLLPELEVSIQDSGVRDANAAPWPSTSGPLWLEIGFGGGEHVEAQARANPGVNIIGCEPYVNGIGNLLLRLQENPAPNLRLFTDDARLLLDTLPPQSISRVFVLFPDPWPKARHHKRRLIQQPFLEQLASVLAPGAELRIATDHVDYLTWILSHVLACPHFTWTARRMADWAQPPADWVRTRYQEKAEEEGRGATFLTFTKVS